MSQPFVLDRFAADAQQPNKLGMKGMLQLDAKNGIFHYARARSLMNLNRYKEAIAYLQKAATVEPNNDEIYVELSDDLSPGVLKCDIPFLYVLMPMRVS